MSFIILASSVSVGAWTVGGNYLNTRDAANKSKIATCQQKGNTHVVLIQDNKVNPQHTDGKLCDTLTITNEDNKVRLMAFGLHEDHQPYNGVAEKELSQGQSLNVMLNEAGSFQFHDHIGDKAHGNFTVTK